MLSANLRRLKLLIIFLPIKKYLSLLENLFICYKYVVNVCLHKLFIFQRWLI